jgi:cysteine desulfurase
VESIYLDYGATTPVRPEVREAMLPFLGGTFGNPSSIHRWGRDAKMKLEEARARIAGLIGAHPTEIVFTRGGTEADNLAILGRARKKRQGAVICSAIEHRAVLRAAQAAESEGSPLRLIPVDGDGVIHLNALDDALDGSVAVVSVMWANNEVGSVQPIAAVAERCAAAGAVFHTDAIQAFGKLEVRVDDLPIKLLSLSAHKIGGPKGVGALYIRKGVHVEPLIFGGGHERGIRAGTEDVAGAVGFSIAAELAVRDREVEMERLRGLRDRFEEALRARVPGLVVNAANAERLPTVLNVSVPGANSEMLLVMLDLEGIGASSGSACSSGGVTPSHVLTTMGLPADIASPSVRFSLGRETTAREIERVAELFPPLMERLRSMATL